LSTPCIPLRKSKREFTSEAKPELRQWIYEKKINHGKPVNYMGIAE